LIEPRSPAGVTHCEARRDPSSPFHSILPFQVLWTGSIALVRIVLFSFSHGRVRHDTIPCMITSLQTSGPPAIVDDLCALRPLACPCVHAKVQGLAWIQIWCLLTATFFSIPSSTRKRQKLADTMVVLGDWPVELWVRPHVM